MDRTYDRIELEKNLSFVMGRPLSLTPRDIGLFSDETLRQAYRARAKELHPDRAMILGQNPDALAERFRALRDAYDVIVDSRKTGDFFRLFTGPAYRAPYVARPAGPAYSRDTATASARHTASRTTGAERTAGATRAGEARLYHAGSIPSCRLRLAQYLYYSKRIDWKTLIDAISWQYAVRPKLGAIALETGYMRHEDIMATLGSKTVDELFGAAACRLGLLTPYALSVLVGRQRLLNLPIGRFFVDGGHLSAKELDECLVLLARHNFDFPKLTSSRPKPRARR